MAMRSFSSAIRHSVFAILAFAAVAAAPAAQPEPFTLNASTHRPVNSALDLSTTTVTFATDQIPQAKVTGLPTALSSEASARAAAVTAEANTRAAADTAETNARAAADTAINAAIALKAADSATVHNTGTETIAGPKTFSSSPAVPDNSFAESKVASLVTDLAAINSAIALKAADSATVHNTGTETIAGPKTFSSAPAVPDNSFAESKVASLLTDLAAINSAIALKAADSATVHNTGSETIAGAKSFTGPASFYSLASNSVVSTVLTTPGAPTITRIGAAGTNTWTYRIVAKLSDGSHTPAGAAASITNGDETLDATNKNSLSWTAVTGAASYDVYRTVAGFSPSTIGKIANVSTNAYIDAGAAGDSSAAPTANTTGRVTGAVHDNGGAVYDITAPSFNGVGDGVTDNLAALTAVEAAIDAAGGQGTILFPPGTFLFSGNAVITSGKSVTSSGGKYGTALLFSSGGLVLGTSTSTFNGTIRGLTIEHTGTLGSLPSGSIGISTAYYQYATIEDVFVATYDIGIKAGGNSSNHLTISNSTIFNIQSKNLWLQDAIWTNLLLTDFGKGGVQNSPSVALLTISGTTDTVLGNFLAFFGDDLVTPTCAAIKFENYTPGNGGFYFNQINTEKIDSVVKTDSASTKVNQLQITNSRLTSGGKFFDQNAATEFDSLDISHNEQIAFYTDSTISNLYRSSFIGNKITRNPFVSPSLTLSSVNGQLNFIGNTSECDLILTGSWKGLSSIGNNFRLTGGTEVGYTISAASGTVNSIGNTKDAGTQPLTVLSTDISQGAWTAMSSIVTGGWSDITAAATYYRSERSGTVRLSGSIHSVTGGSTLNAGVTMLNALPSGFRPPRTVVFAVPCNTGSVNISIDQNGIGRLDSTAPSGVSISLDGISFSTN
jgi:hypothetical protein